MKKLLLAVLAISAIVSCRNTEPVEGQPWKGWKKGEFQVHFIYTGVAESMFYIFPDGTTMLLDCGDHNAVGRGELAVPVLPDPGRHSGEWIARYVERVNPHGNKVDYMMLSHYHNDHAGCEAFNAGKEGEYCFSGFSLAAEYLEFGKAFDRLWPDYNDPLPLDDSFDDGTVALMKKFYSRMSSERGMEIERFEVGAVDQLRMLHRPGKYPGFSIRNICGNGRVCGEDGVVRDLYAERISRDSLKFVNENGMSLGFVVSYGPFRFYTSGDFSDKWKNPDGSIYRIEDEIADVCGAVDVAKINHHGHNSMTPKLVSALSASVYVSCVWDQLHNLPGTMSLLSDRSLYPGERVICPEIFPAERRAEDNVNDWYRDIYEPSFEGGHIVLNVEEGGLDYSISYLTAADESMTVRSVKHFKTKGIR